MERNAIKAINSIKECEKIEIKAINSIKECEKIEIKCSFATGETIKFNVTPKIIGQWLFRYFKSDISNAIMRLEKAYGNKRTQSRTV